jgi:hypothetical protein
MTPKVSCAGGPLQRGLPATSAARSLPVPGNEEAPGQYRRRDRSGWADQEQPPANDGYGQLGNGPGLKMWRGSLLGPGKDRCAVFAGLSP